MSGGERRDEGAPEPGTPSEPEASPESGAASEPGPRPAPAPGAEPGPHREPGSGSAPHADPAPPWTPPTAAPQGDLPWAAPGGYGPGTGASPEPHGPVGRGEGGEDPAHPPAPPVEWVWPADGAPGPVPAAEPEYRLSSMTMIVGPVGQLKTLVAPILLGLILGGFNPWVLGATGAAVVALLVTGFVTWKTVRYQVGSERLEIRRGLIRRSRRTIPLERIRGVDVTSTLLHRLLGVAVVRIEAAAGGVGNTEDGKLDAVTREEADRLRRVLLHRRAVLSGQAQHPAPSGSVRADRSSPPVAADPSGLNGPEDAESADAAVTHFTMPPSWYFYALLSLGYLFTPFAALAALVSFLQQGANGRVTEDVLDWLADADRALLLSGAALLLLLLVILMPVFAVVSYAVTHWGFTLRSRDGSLVAERGLFTRRSVTLERRRIRGHELLDNPLERTRAAVRLRAIVTGLGDTATRAVLLPIGARGRVEEVIAQALTPFGGRLVRHPRAALWRRLIRSVVPFALAAAAAAAAGLAWAAGLLALLALLGVPLGVDRYRALGHGYDGENVSVRSGSLRRSQAVVERSAVIGWTWTQTLFQRRARLASMQVTVGAGSGGYTAIDASFEGSVAFAAGVTPDMVRPFLDTGGARPGTAEPGRDGAGDGPGGGAGDGDGRGRRGPRP